MAFRNRYWSSSSVAKIPQIPVQTNDTTHFQKPWNQIENLPIQPCHAANLGPSHGSGNNDGPEVLFPWQHRQYIYRFHNGLEMGSVRALNQHKPCRRVRVAQLPMQYWPILWKFGGKELTDLLT